MRFKITLFLFAIIIFGCRNYPHYDIPKYELFQYDVGDYLIYRSNHNHIDTLIVHSIYRGYWGDNSYGGPSSEYYEYQKVALYFPKDKDSIDSEHMWPTDLKIWFSGSVDPIEPSKILLWKRNLRFDFEDQETYDSITIDGIQYDNVYIFHRPTDFADKSTLVRKIHFNYKSGILKYENIDDEVFEFIGKL